MFYLKQFFLHLKDYPLRGFLFLSLGILTLFLYSQNQTLDEQVKSLIHSPGGEPYFYALISSSKKTERLRRKLANLPGVHKVQLLKSQTLKDKANLLLKDYALNFKKELFNMDYLGLKVVFSKKIRLRAQQLIRDYLIRLVGKEDIILGSVRKVEPQVKTRKLTEWIKTGGSYFILGLLSLIWFLSGVWILEPLKKTSHLLEQFQRRSNITLKTYTAGIILIVFVGTIISVIYAKIQWSGLGMALALMGVSLMATKKKYQWND